MGLPREALQVPQELAGLGWGPPALLGPRRGKQLSLPSAPCRECGAGGTCWGGAGGCFNRDRPVEGDLVGASHPDANLVAVGGGPGLPTD